MSVALKIKLANGAVKTMRFTSEMSVSEACDQIFEKTNEARFEHVGSINSSLSLLADSQNCCRHGSIAVLHSRSCFIDARIARDSQLLLRDCF